MRNAFELAEIDLKSMINPKRPSFFERVRRIFARPPSELKTITYRGGTPPQLSAMIRRNGQYYTGRLPWDMFDKIRVHPIVKLGLVVKAAPIITALREVKVRCEDPKIAAFIKDVFVAPLLLSLADTSVMMSYIFGVCPLEKVWEVREVRVSYTADDGSEAVAWDGPALVYKKFVFVHPRSVEKFNIDPDNNSFDGFEQKKSPADTKNRLVPAWKAFVYINRQLFGGFWGESELEDIYPYWYYEEFFRALQSDYLRFSAIPPIVGYAPPGKRVDDDGNEVDNMEYAGSILEKAWESLVIILPFELDDSGKQQAWSYKELSVGSHSDIYTKAIEELDVMILRGLIVPERTVTQNMAAVGSYNQAEQHAERMLDAAKLETDRLLEYINEYAIPQLIEDNFGAGSAQCTLFSGAISETLKVKLHSVLVTLLQNDKDGRLSRQVAFADLLDYLNIPYRRVSDDLPAPTEPPVDPASPDGE